MGELKNETALILASLFFCHLFDVPLLSFSSFPLVIIFLSGHDWGESSRLVPAKNCQKHEGEFVPSSHGIKKQRGRLVEKVASELG